MRSFSWLSGLKSLCGEPVRAIRREKRVEVLAAQLELLEERSFPTASSLFVVTEGMTTQSAAADADAVAQFQQDFTRLVEGLIAAEQGTTQFTNLEKERDWATDKINKGDFDRLEKLLETILGEKAQQLQQSGVQAFARAFVMAIQGTSHATTFDEDMNWTVNRANLSRENEVHLNRLRDVLHEAFNEKANDLQRAGIRQFAQAFAAAIQGTSHSTSPGDDYVWARNRASNPNQADLDRLHQVLNEVIVQKEQQLRQPVIEEFARGFAAAIQGTTQSGGFEADVRWARHNANSGNVDRLRHVLNDALGQKEQQLRRSGTLPFANVYAQALRGTSNYANFDKEVSWARNNATSGNTGRLRDVLESSINEMSRKSNATVGTWYARVMSEAGRSADSGWASNMAKRGRFNEVAARVRDAVWSRYDQVPLGSEAGRQEIGNWYASVMSNVGIGQSGDAGWAMWRANRGEFQGHVAKSVRDSLFAKLDSASRGSAASREALSQWYAGIMELLGKGDPQDASWAAHRMERGDFRSHVAKSVDESLFASLNNVGNGNAAARIETARWYASIMEAVGKANPDDGSWARHRINRGDFLSHVAKSVETELFDMLQRVDRGDSAGQAAIGNWYASVVQALGQADGNDATWASWQAGRGGFSTRITEEINGRFNRSMKAVGEGLAAEFLTRTIVEARPELEFGTVFQRVVQGIRNDDQPALRRELQHAILSIADENSTAIGEWYASTQRRAQQGDERDASWATNRANRSEFWSHIVPSVRETFTKTFSRLKVDVSFQVSDVTATLFGNILDVQGTKRDDHIVFRQTGNSLSIDGVEITTPDGRVQSLDLKDIKKVIVQGGRGNDVIDASDIDAVFSIDGGSGDDVLLGGNSNDTLRGGLDDDILIGGRGNDRLIDWAGKTNFLIGGTGFDRVEIAEPVQFALGIAGSPATRHGFPDVTNGEQLRDMITRYVIEGVEFVDVVWDNMHVEIECSASIGKEGDPIVIDMPKQQTNTSEWGDTSIETSGVTPNLEGKIGSFLTVYTNREGTGIKATVPVHASGIGVEAGYQYDESSSTHAVSIGPSWQMPGVKEAQLNVGGSCVLKGTAQELGKWDLSGLKSWNSRAALTPEPEDNRTWLEKQADGVSDGASDSWDAIRRLGEDAAKTTKTNLETLHRDVEEIKNNPPKVKVYRESSGKQSGGMMQGDGDSGNPDSTGTGNSAPSDSGNDADSSDSGQTTGDSDIRTEGGTTQTKFEDEEVRTGRVPGQGEVPDDEWSR